MPAVDTLIILVGLLAVAGAIVYASRLIARQLTRRQHETTIQAMVATFSPAVAAIHGDPRALLIWLPALHVCRKLFPDAFRELDAAGGREFPFGRVEADDAHARWTAQWLAWERDQDAAYKLKATKLERELEQRGDAGAMARAELEALEREKLQQYQQRYEEYIRTAKALSALVDRERVTGPGGP